MRTYGLILAGALALAGGAQAQTTTEFDYNVNVPTIPEASFTFTLSSASSVFVEEATPSATVVQGVGFLSQGSTAFTVNNTGLVDVFSLTDGSGNPLTNTTYLAAGTYTFEYDFANSNSAPTGTTVSLDVYTAPVAAPEIDPSSAMAGLTLLGGGLATLRGRRFKSKKA